ncbi:hypothetical protein I7I50_03594 [Histoplasma capsulatum G186AR]|uniref:Uncharacterized protein n=1 Tax=Ajellomyces capsulatus TaxID=5037 RepID=A0A8H7YNM1_AJECA|nr:hypothetical protein I7I52_04501 [Histoplasma capsulatum]QSS74697.1 hypothetical protein I7I50_03594 [Histoplasma capsulatum G186AR]
MPLKISSLTSTAFNTFLIRSEFWSMSRRSRASFSASGCQRPEPDSGYGQCRPDSHLVLARFVEATNSLCQYSNICTTRWERASYRQAPSTK